MRHIAVIDLNAAMHINLYRHYINHFIAPFQ
jgi:hypothetical protein